MPRKSIGPELRSGQVRGDLADKLAAELRSGREYGQPLIYERQYRTGKASVTVIWDAWHGLPLQERTATILRAYDLAEGPESRDRVALANGLTVPEAHAAGMLPYQILPALRPGDPVTPAQVRQAMLEEGASQLADGEAVQLRFATQEEAEAARHRLSQRLPGSEPIWLINRELMTQDLAQAPDWAESEET
jgi:hypothetical protein